VSELAEGLPDSAYSELYLSPAALSDSAHSTVARTDFAPDSEADYSLAEAHVASAEEVVEVSAPESVVADMVAWEAVVLRTPS
jgi:hypothetical protein